MEWTTENRTQTLLSVVFEGDGVRGDVHLRFVLDQFDDSTLGPERIAQLDTTRLAGTVEVLDDVALTAGAAELHALRRYCAYDPDR